MTPDERSALLALWAEHPETAPLDVVYVCGTFQTTDTTFSNVHAAALARDRLVELLVNGDGLVMTNFVNETCMVAQDKDGPIFVRDTRLLALIAAYRAMKGVK